MRPARALRSSSIPVRAAALTGLAATGLAALLAVEVLLAQRGAQVPFEPPSRTPVTLGSGPALEYVVVGDSTAAGQGAPYDRGIAMATARHLARRHRVTLTNLGVSGARMREVESDQLPLALARRPDVVLVSAGANDVTHLTGAGTVTRSLEAIAERLRAVDSDVTIVVTAAPDMGSIPRLAQPLRALAGWRTGRLNAAIEEVVADRGLVLAPIARETGPAFRADAGLFAADRFHPDARGYATWVPVLNGALDEALR